MPIAKLTPNVDLNKKPIDPIVEKASYLGIVADHKDTPVESLVAYLDGMPWTVNYFSQMLGEHSDLHELDVGQSPAMQQYQKLNGLELRVTAPLQSSYDQQNAITTVSGSSVIVHVLPNVNDYFVADAGSRECGLYRVKNVERRTFNRDSVYIIDYDLVAYTRESETKWKDIESKVVRQYYFSKDRLVEGLSPVLREEEYVESFNIKRTYREIVRSYMSDFFNRGLMTLLVPGRAERVYDPNVPIFLSKVIEGEDAQELRDMKYVSMDYERYLSQKNIFTVLLDRRYEDLKRCHQKVCVVGRYVFNKSSWLHGPVYWDIDKYVYPLDVNDDRRIQGLNHIPHKDSGAEYTGKALMELDEYKDVNTYKDISAPIPLIKSVFIDDYYVFSGSFYKGERDLSVLELLVKDYLKVQTMDRGMLKQVYEAYHTWPSMERFYYAPILILLLREALRGYYR